MHALAARHMLSFFVALMLLSTCDMAHEHMRSTVASLRVSSRKEFDSPQCPNPGTALREQTPLFTERQNVLRLRGGYRDSDVLRHYVLVMSKADEGEDLDRLHIAFDAAKQAIPPPDTAENNEEAQTGAENSGRDANVRLEGPSEGGSEQGDSQMSVSSAQGTGVGDNSPSPAREPVQSSPQHSQMSAAQLAHRIGVVLFDVKQNASGAEFYLREALRLDPTHVDAAADYACLVHRVHRDADKAERLYEHVLTRAPGHVATLCNAAWLFYTHKDNAERAESYLRLALSTEPYHPDALHMLARVLSEVRENVKEAEVLYLRSLEHHPNHVDTLWSYGTFLMDYRGDEEGAEKIWARAVRVDPTIASM